MIPLPEDLPTPTGYRRVVDVYVSVGNGPHGGSSKRLQDWIEHWAAEDVDVLLAADHSHLLAVERLSEPPLTLVSTEAGA